MADPEEARPARVGTGHELSTDQGSSSVELYRRMDQRAQDRLRIAWLTVHAELLYGVDEGGQLSAQLLDLRDLLEAQDQARWAS